MDAKRVNTYALRGGPFDGCESAYLDFPVGEIGLAPGEYRWSGQHLYKPTGETDAAGLSICDYEGLVPLAEAPEVIERLMVRLSEHYILGQTSAPSPSSA